MIEIFYFVLKFVEFFPLMSSAKSNMLGRKKKKKTEKSFSQNLPRLLYCFFLHSLHVRSNQVVLKSTPVAHGLSYAPRNPLNKQQKAPTSTLCCSFVTELSPRYSLSLCNFFTCFCFTFIFALQFLFSLSVFLKFVWNPNTVYEIGFTWISCAPTWFLLLKTRIHFHTPILT